MRPELKPCPFCGSSAEIIGSWVPRSRVRTVSCVNDDCFAHALEQDEQGGFVREFLTDLAAAEAWNTRSGADK